MQLWPYVISWCNAFEDRFCRGRWNRGGEDRSCTSKIGGIGKVGRHIQDMPCTWRLYWLAVARP